MAVISEWLSRAPLADAETATTSTTPRRSLFELLSDLNRADNTFITITPADDDPT